MTQKSAALLVIAMSGVVLVAAAIVSDSGLRPYGEQAVNEQIEREDSALCSKFGFAAATQKFNDCLLDLADLRKRNMELLAAYSWL